MTGRILIIEDEARQRTTLQIRLLSSQYDIVACVDCDDANRAMRHDVPDLLVISLDLLCCNPVDYVRTLRGQNRFAQTPIICLDGRPWRDTQLAALGAGADEVLQKSPGDALLLARIRSLLRRRDTAEEFGLQDAPDSALELAEDAATFKGPCRIAIVAEQPTLSEMWRDALLEEPAAGRVECLPRHQVFSSAAPGSFDLYVIDGADHDDVATLRLLSELRSRPDTRHAAVLVVMPGGHDDLSAMALDLGADDLLPDGFSRSELRLRVDRQLGRKRRTDRMRDGVRNGLQAALVDPLTGAYNRRYAMPRLARLADRARSSGRGLAVMMFDIDHFKSINDTHGHGAGDRVLVELARRLQDNLGPRDLLARMGGEEFLVAIPDQSATHARRIAEHLRRMIDSEPFVLAPGLERRITTSVGVAMSRGDLAPDETPAQLCERADAALYSSKAAGRNKVTLSETAAA